MNGNVYKKCNFGDKSTVGSSQNGQNIPKKTRNNYPLFYEKSLYLTFPLKICTFLKGIRELNIHFLPFVHFIIKKKLKCFSNIEYKIFPIKRFLVTYYLFVTYIQIDKVACFIQIQRFKNFREPFPHLKCKNGSECGIGMDCPDIYISELQLLNFIVKFCFPVCD